jgi:hypothetical protein
MVSARGGPLPPIVATIGGSGSHRLIEALSIRFPVAAKPDNVFRINHHELCPVGLDCPHTHRRSDPWYRNRSLILDEFAELSGGYVWHSGPLLGDGLPDYVAWARCQRHAVVLGTAGELGLLSEHRVSEVVVLLRDPVQVLLSWGKPYRHGHLVDAMGGLNHETTLDYIATRVVRLATEARRLQGLGLLRGVIRFEHAQSDADQLGLGWAFEDFEDHRSNAEGILLENTLHHMRQVTNPHLAPFYKQ